MKKSLVALAAFAVVGGAYAQSTVTLSGTFDPSYSRVQTTTAAGVKTTATTLANSQQGTTGLTFSGTEDLGGGLKANFLHEVNFDATEGGAAVGTAGAVSLATGQVFLGLNGGFGNVQLGRANSHTLSAQVGRSPFGTKVGSGFGSTSGASNVRNNDSIKYTSPTFGGVTVGMTHGLKVGAIAAFNEVGAFYATGPLSLGMTLVRQNNVLNQTNLNAQYNFGVARLFAGFHQQDNDMVGIAKVKNSGYNVAVSAPVGPVILMANYGTLNVKDTRIGDRDLFAVGARYDLSKRTNAYVRLVNDRTDAAGTTSSKINTTLVGLQHTF